MIGVFDSWLWWLSVWKELAKLMPNQDFCYIADSAYCPYWRKTPEELQERSRNLTKFLINQWNCDLIVVACNTATAAAIDILRSAFSIPFVWMEPAIKPALLKSKTWVVWVLATAWTFKWALYHRTLTQFQWDVKVIEEIWDGLVELVESNQTETQKAYNLLNKYINPMIEENVDHIVLWCTHYPFLTPMINKILSEKNIQDRINIINPAPAVAAQTKKILNSLNIIKKDKESVWNFYSTWNKDILSDFVDNIYNQLLENRDINTKWNFLSFNHIDI